MKPRLTLRSYSFQNYFIFVDSVRFGKYYYIGWSDTTIKSSSKVKLKEKSYQAKIISIFNKLQCCNSSWIDTHSSRNWRYKTMRRSLRRRSIQNTGTSKNVGHILLIILYGNKCRLVDIYNYNANST